MIKEIGFIAIGQAGGNIGKLFEARGHNVLYVNTSMEDLNTLVDVKKKYHIAGGEGSGKDRGRAKDLIINDFDDLGNTIAENMSEEFIFVIFSAGGGTGSGSSPLLIDYLTQAMPDRKIGAITILPAISESLKAQVNAYECLRELQNLDELCAAFVIDNNGHGDKMVINSMFAELFSQMLKIPTYIDSRSNVDVSELKETLTAHGCAVITKLPQNQSSTPRLLDSFKNNIFAQLEEDEAIQYLLLSMASGIDVEAVKKKVGTPIDVFQGFNQRETICVLSGLSFPMTRIAGIAAEVNELKNKIQRSRIQRPAAPDDTLNMDSMALGRKSNKPKHKKTKEELFANYRK